MNSKKDDLLFYGLLVLFVVSLFHRLDFLHLKFEEPRRALVSWEMIQSGDWLHPSIYGLSYFNKPPIYNWVLAVCMKIFGTADWVIRLPTVLSLLTITGINFHYWKSKIGLQPALRASVFFATSVNIYFYFSFQGEIDMFYTLIIYCQILSIIHFYEKGDRWKLFLVSYTLTSVGFLTKGLPSIGFQGLTLIGMMLFTRNFRWFFSIQQLFSGLLSVAIMSGFFYAYHLTGGPTELYLAKLFFEGARRTVNHQESFPFLKSFLSFLPLMIYLLSPWVLLGLLGIKKTQLVEQFKNPWLRYALVFLVFNLPLYWFSAGTRDRYLYMFLPYCMLWIAPWVLHAVSKKSLQLFTAFFTGLVGLVAFGALFTSAQDIPRAALVLPLLGTLLLTIGLVTFQRKLNPVLTWFALLIALRFTFNLLVLDVRKNEESTAAYPTIVTAIQKQIKDKPVYYYAPMKEEEVQLPILEQSVIYRTVPRLDYTFTYYLNRATGKSLQHTETYPGDGYVIRASTDKQQGEDVLLEFELNNVPHQLVKSS